MNNLVLALLMLSNTTSLFAWDFGAKADAQKFFTDNVGLTGTDRISDSYTTYGGYLQLKNKIFKVKAKAKTEKYQKQKENDNYTIDLSFQYKHSKQDDYSLAIFKQVYNGTPSGSSDSTSDNSGARLSANFSQDLDKNTNIYFSPSATYKKYPKMSNRIDKLMSASAGLEKYLSTQFMFNPEASAQYALSSDSYYKNISYGPSLLLSFTPNDDWEIFVNGSYTYTRYSGRNVDSTVNGKVVSKNEFQESTSADLGVTYNATSFASLQVKYQTNKNTSNNTTSGYKANVASFAMAFRF